ncbi:helix-turn-helix domain-containing protein [Nocardia sp. NPDC049220]|uniref:helix-turn-helix domain-containing protein n=1 Tax=Nocardia sp. NPDC049220 TaxID=3155273 RepID=UPI00340F875D
MTAIEWAEARNPVTDRGTGGAMDEQVRELQQSEWYTTDEVAVFLKVDASSLRRWRTARPPQGPPFVVVSDRVIRYSGADVIAYLSSRRVDPAAA